MNAANTITDEVRDAMRYDHPNEVTLVETQVLLRAAREAVAAADHLLGSAPPAEVHGARIALEQAAAMLAVCADGIINARHPE